MPMLYLIILLVFLSVALLTGAVLYPFITRRSTIEERLAKLSPLKFEQQEAPTLIIKQSKFQNTIVRLGSIFPPPAREMGKYKKAVVSAGFRKEMLFVFWGAKMLLAIALPVLFVLFVSLPNNKVFDAEFMLYTVGMAIIGFLVPSVWLSRLAENRKMKIFHTLPDMLDLLTVCVEAGLGIDVAMVRACENSQFKKDPLADEIKIAALESRAGKPRAEALKDMAERTAVEDVKSFVAMLIQTERFGTSLSLAMRVHSDSLRTKRRQIAEEAAAKTAVKMMFPLVFFIFPALMVIMLGPAVIMFGKIFK